MNSVSLEGTSIFESDSFKSLLYYTTYEISHHCPSHLIVVTPTVSADLDLKEANVVRVEYQIMEQNSYKFDVTLYHDDDGEAPQYADLWIVEDLNSSELGRRELLHSHGTQEFTRSTTFPIPSNTSKLVVRAHDQTHNWGGQVALIDLSANSTAFFDQGQDPRNFTDSEFDQIINTYISSTNTTKTPSYYVLPVLILLCIYSVRSVRRSIYTSDNI